MLKMYFYKLFFASLFFAQAFNGYGQTSICSYLQMASESFYKKNYSLALDNLLAVRNSRPVEACDILNLRIGQCYSYLNDTLNANLELAKFINDSSISSPSIKYYGVGCEVKWDSIRALPIWIFYDDGCHNNKNRACLELFNLSIKKNDLISAHYFLDLADRKYKYQTTCGNDREWHDIELKEMYHQLYKAKNDTNLILHNLLSGIFLYDSVLRSELIVFLRAKYSRDEISYEMKNASNTYEEHSLKSSDGRFYLKKTIRIFGVEVDLNSSLNYFSRGQTSANYKHQLSTMTWFLNFAQ